MRTHQSTSNKQPTKKSANVNNSSGLSSNQNIPSLFQFLRVEVTRNYAPEHDPEQFSERREKIYSFMRIPRELERFLLYGLMQCIDAFLFVYTFLPIRVSIALWTIVTIAINKLGLLRSGLKPVLVAPQICDLLKALILLIGSVVMYYYVDVNMLYHLVKSQSVIKLYIFYNMLEVGDRLFSSFGQDTIDSLFWTATEPKERKRDSLGVLPHFIFAQVYVILHSILVLLQATTLNVAINSSNKALLTIMMSNNFVELKSSVFKKFDKTNLYQVTCSDVRERFHLIILLAIVTLQTMREYSWRFDQFFFFSNTHQSTQQSTGSSTSTSSGGGTLITECLLVLLAEIFVDWIKHAFITRFNALQVDQIYRQYTLSLAYDVAQTRQKHAFSDHSDLVARRMGFIPLPLGVVVIRVLCTTISLDSIPSLVVFLLFYVCLISFKILNNVFVLGHACTLIDTHRGVENIGANYAGTVGTPVSRVSSTTANTTNTTNISSIVGGVPDELALNASPIFANSNVDLKHAKLNEELLRVETITGGGGGGVEDDDGVFEGFEGSNGLKRAESEPTLL